MRSRLLIVGIVSLVACRSPKPPVEPIPGVQPPPPAPPTSPQTAAVSMSLAEVGIDESNLDRSVNPCEDFYQFACGGWQKKNEIPADLARWGSFSAIAERNNQLLRKYLEDFAAGKGNPSDAYGDKLGAFWGSCMDEARIEATAREALAAELKNVDRVKDIPSLAREVARQVLVFRGGSALLNFGSQQDFEDATQVIGVIDQGGYTLPDRDYYLKNDGKFPELRKRYEEHVAKMFVLAGDKPERAAKDAQTVLRIERALAEAALSRVERRDPHKIYHRIGLAGLEQKAPRFPWKEFLRTVKHPEVASINVTWPDFFAAMNGMLTKEPMEAWRTYLRWHVIHRAAPGLSRAFVDENFRFFGATLSGIKELAPRWKRCVQAADQALGEALAQPFVRETFGAEGRKTAEEMVVAIEQAMRKNLGELSWMDAATRAQALVKLAEIANKIGYPQKLKNYDTLMVSRDAYLGNLLRASEFHTLRDLDKIGKPLDRTEWLITPPTVNAYYEASMNEMAFPAGILQPPFFARTAHPAVNFGAIGMVMGHELTHGFDDEGRQFDAKGNLRDWWTPPVNERFLERAECVVKQYDGYVAIDDLHVNGKLTLGENIADLGGLKLAFRAYMETRKEAGAKPVKAGGFTEEQLFFLGTAQSWCAKTRPENAAQRVLTDPHSPPEYRVNGPMSNLGEFQQAFQCKPGSKMVRQDRCDIW